jgi:hypothetical protein
MRVLLALTVLLSPIVSWAGNGSVSHAPAMNEAGLITLGVGLAGAGLALLRRK